MNGGVGFLMKKNKVDVIWGEAKLTKPGEIVVGKTAEEADGAAGAAAEEHAGRGHLHGQAHHRRDRRAAARAARHRAGRQADLDLFRGDGAAGDAEIAAGHGLGRHRHRVRLLLPHHGRRGDRGRGDAAGHAGRGRRDLRLRQEAVREAGHEDPARGQGDEGREGREFGHRPCRDEGRQGREDHRRPDDLGRRRAGQYRESRPRGARREDRPRLHRHRRLWQDQCAGHLCHRRRRRPADAGAQGRA